MPRDNSLLNIKCLSTFMCQRNWIIIVKSTKSNSSPQNIAIFCMINSHRSQSPKSITIAMKSRTEPQPFGSQRRLVLSKEPEFHQFERRYITPTVTYVEKPKRVQLNPSVNWLVCWVPVIYLRNQMGTGSTYVENYQGLRKMLRWKNLKGQKNETYESHSFYLALT